MLSSRVVYKSSVNNSRAVYNCIEQKLSPLNTTLLSWDRSTDDDAADHLMMLMISRWCWWSAVDDADQILLSDVLLAPQSGALRISAYGDFQPNPNPSIHPLIAFEHSSLSIVIRNSARRPRQINVDHVRPKQESILRNFPNFPKFSKFFQIFQNFPNFPKFSKIF